MRSGSNGVVEVIVGRDRRRRWSLADKLRIVAETQEAGVTVGDVAARHGAYPSLVFTWRRQAREGRLAPEPTGFLPVQMLQAPATVSDAPAVAARPVGLVEITLPDGVCVRVDQQVDARALRRILGALRG